MVKRILILGAGFAGLRVAKDLSKKMHVDWQITLIDKNKGHLYTPDLYEIASSPHEKITEQCLVELRDTVVTPIDSMFSSRVEFIHDEILRISPEVNSVELKNKGTIQYDYLAICLGSSTNTYNLPGLEQFSYPVKTINDAIAINCHLDTYFKELWKAGKKPEIYINIGGGGATGVEFSAELSSYVKFLCAKYKYPIDNVKIRIIQGGNDLIGLGSEVSTIALNRLKLHGIDVLFGSYINNVEANQIVLKTKEGQITTIKSDLLLWTGGVKINPVVSNCFGDEKSGGAIMVNKFLQNEKYKNIFACGDSAFVTNQKNERVLMMAQFAFDEAKFLARNILATISGKPMVKYMPGDPVFIIPIAGKFGIVKYQNHVFSGYWCWVLRRLVDLRYCLHVLPPWKAFKKWMHGNRVFVEND